MRALSLLGVLILAKLLILIGRPISISAWTPIAFFWQDVLIAVIFGLIDAAAGRAWFGRTLYAAAVAYVTINLPVERVLSSPLTWPMLHAARGALSDSIKHHATPVNVALMLLVAGTGVALPLLLPLLHRHLRSCLWPQTSRTVRFGSWVLAIVAALPVVVLGPLAHARVDTEGLDRNAITALVITALPRISASASDLNANEDWRISPLDSRAEEENLSRWRGAAAGRNVVLILLESAGAQYLRPYGASRDPMPNLSRLAQTSILFEHAYSVYPESIKELFSVLCSRYPALDTEAESYARLSAPSLASVLEQEGYRTALFHSGRFMYLGMSSVVANRGYEVLEDAGAIGGDRESSFGVDEASTVRRALSWIDSLGGDKRFFLTYLPIAGHHPYDTPGQGPFPDRTDSDRYLNALHYADSALGTLLDGFRVRGLYDRTLFVIFGDHGEAFGQHSGNYGHSLFLYDENVRVPYLIAAPGMITERSRVSRTISLIDTAPTILDLIGVPPPPRFQGSTALDPRPRMALFYTDYSLSLLGLRDGCWKHIYEMDSGRSKLFDLSRDASETSDLAATNSARMAAYRNQLLRWSAAQKTLLAGQLNEYHPSR